MSAESMSMSPAQEPALRDLKSLEESITRLVQTSLREMKEEMQTGFQKMNDKLDGFENTLQEGLRSGVPTKYAQRIRDQERQLRELRGQLASSEATAERLRNTDGMKLGQALQAISTAAEKATEPAKTKLTELVRDVVRTKGMDKAQIRSRFRALTRVNGEDTLPAESRSRSDKEHPRWPLFSLIASQVDIINFFVDPANRALANMLPQPDNCQLWLTGQPCRTIGDMPDDSLELPVSELLDQPERRREGVASKASTGSASQAASTRAPGTDAAVDLHPTDLAQLYSLPQDPPTSFSADLSATLMSQAPAAQPGTSSRPSVTARSSSSTLSKRKKSGSPPPATGNILYDNYKDLNSYLAGEWGFTKEPEATHLHRSQSNRELSADAEERPPTQRRRAETTAAVRVHPSELPTFYSQSLALFNLHSTPAHSDPFVAQSAPPQQSTHLISESSFPPPSFRPAMERQPSFPAYPSATAGNRPFPPTFTLPEAHRMRSATTSTMSSASSRPQYSPTSPVTFRAPTSPARSRTTSRNTSPTHRLRRQPSIASSLHGSFLPEETPGQLESDAESRTREARRDASYTVPIPHVPHDAKTLLN